MNLAIVIGVSKYDNLQCLDACDRDQNAIFRIVGATSKYNDLLRIDASHSNCSQAKQQIVDFVKKHKGASVEEVVFYYSGHGDFDGKDFYYLWSDYDEKKRRQTSIQNEELDTWLRGLQSDLVIKIIDACHSGISYIKDADALGNYLKSTQSSFKKCYFLFSSLADQNSFANATVSHFTASFIKSLSGDVGRLVRFKDIIDHISDDFENAGTQTPFFVTQAEFTEVFTTLNEKLVFELEAIEEGFILKSDGADGHEAGTLGSVIEKDAQRYVAKERVLEIAAAIFKTVQTHISENLVSRLFEKSVTAETLMGAIPNGSSIAKWLVKNDQNIFAEVTFSQRQRSKRVPKSGAHRISAMTGLFDEDDDSKFKTVFETYDEPASFKSNIEIPYAYIRVFLEPAASYPNLSPFSFYLLPLFSKTDLYLFYGLMEFREKAWSEFLPKKEDFRWQYNTSDLKSWSDDATKQLLDELWKSLAAKLEERFGKGPETTIQTTDGPM